MRSEVGDQRTGSKRVKPQKAQKTQRKVKDQTEIFRLCDLIRETSFSLYQYLRHDHLEKVYERAFSARNKAIFTCCNNPKGNADTERVIHIIKEDLIWIKEWKSPSQLEERLKAWIIKYNTDFPHSSLN